MKLLIASGNQGKLREIRAILATDEIDVLDLSQFEHPPEVIEDGDSFSANACKKACQMAGFSRCLTLADDSGLVVPALRGAPGIFSARYAGEGASDAENNHKLLREIAALDQHERSAYFCCVMALATPEGECHTFEGRIYGQLIDELRGPEGFGYDPLFLVPEYGQTLGELSAQIKNRISHRRQALNQVCAHLRQSGRS